MPFFANGFVRFENCRNLVNLKNILKILARIYDQVTNTLMLVTLLNQNHLKLSPKIVTNIDVALVFLPWLRLKIVSLCQIRRNSFSVRWDVVQGSIWSFRLLFCPEEFHSFESHQFWNFLRNILWLQGWANIHNDPDRYGSRFKLRNCNVSFCPLSCVRMKEIKWSCK